MITLQKGDVSIQFDHIFRTDYGAVLGINMKQVVSTPLSHLYEVATPASIVRKKQMRKDLIFDINIFHQMLGHPNE